MERKTVHRDEPIVDGFLRSGRTASIQAAGADDGAAAHQRQVQIITGVDTEEAPITFLALFNDGVRQSEGVGALLVGDALRNHRTLFQNVHAACIQHARMGKSAVCNDHFTVSPLSIYRVSAMAILSVSRAARSRI